MGRINLLTSKVYNRIAAGEVVDRPYSIVKELVENSIDAGAKNVLIEIVDGGKTSISITDDGCGMDRVDLENCIKPHATSKIKNASDLDAISTFGFRGEALASIASVTKLKIASKTADMQIGAQLSIEGGDDVQIIDYGMNVGTEIVANNLFFNTPAREKFLRSSRSEEGEISSTVAKFILGNPSVSFKYVSNGKLIYQSFGDGLESAMAQVFSASILSDCFYIDTVKNGLKINGYISKHHFSKGNRSHQFVFLNNRNIVNQTISSAISNAYSSYLMRGRFPFYVLNVTVPNEIVDVNVHPNKSDVRFSNNQIIYSSIYSVISKVLDGSGDALNIIVNSNDTNKNMSDIKVSTGYDKVAKPQKFDVFEFNDSFASSKEDKSNADDIFLQNKAFLENLEKANLKPNVDNIVNSNVKTPAQLELINKNDVDFQIVGQVLNTFLVLEDGKNLYLVDQHAAHERILYDKLIQSYNNDSVAVQPLLIPIVLNVNNAESEFLFSKIELLKKIGFDISEFGNNTFRICSIPAMLTSINIDTFFADLLSDLNELKSIAVTDLMADKIAQKACKSAIKSGDKLDDNQISLLIDMIKGDLGLKCPHGRPVVVKITRTEIDKWFKRIV